MHDFSLIMGTLGRSSEIEDFIRSLLSQTGAPTWELIIVDQNLDDRVDTVLRAVGPLPPGCRIELVKERIKGLSRARNIGLARACGAIIAYPDDDCVYSPGVLAFVRSTLVPDQGGPDVVTLRDVHRLEDLPHVGGSGRRLPLTAYTIFARAISYTIFVGSQHAQVRFDEQFGVGASFGAAEETDYLFAILNRGGRMFQCDGPRIFHPNKTLDYKDTQRVASYNVGIGAFFAKNLSLVEPGLWAFYFVSNLKILLRMLQYTLNGNALKRRWYALIFVNRHRGWVRYRKYRRVAGTP